MDVALIICPATSLFGRRFAQTAGVNGDCA